jgi:tRNA nucleotidyltransferase (CCA-adding enzyme)
LSYAHVKYIKSKIKSKKAINEIKLAKAFCYAKKCYGAESYINGFSGYSLELLIYKYKSFLNFVKAIARIGKEKEIIDIEKKYKNKREILLNLNSSKIKSPIVLIDPTYPRRNALAALSEETFTKFREECRKFIKNPSINDFEIKKIDVEKLKNYALKRKNDFIFIEISTAKQEGDIAGSKLIKFYRHLIKEVEKYFNIKNKSL